MRFKRPENFEQIAMDGWITLSPGESCCLAVDTPARPSVEELHIKMRHVRGMVLSAGFTIENNLVLVQLADKFGTTDRTHGGEDFAKYEEYLRAETTGIERRLKGAKDIIRRVLGKPEGDKTVQDMSEYRRLRHLCAHRPCWLEGIWEPDAGIDANFPKGRTTGFRLFIADSEFIWEIDDHQVEEWVTLLNRTAAAADKALRIILESKNPKTIHAAQ